MSRGSIKSRQIVRFDGYLAFCGRGQISHEVTEECGRALKNSVRRKFVSVGHCG